jgi:predicted glycosyltransferase
MFNEPHSTKQIEDCVGWGLETTPEVLVDTEHAEGIPDRPSVLSLCERVRCPILVIQGTSDAITGRPRGVALADAFEGRASLALLEGSGHGVHARDPVKVDLLIREFVDRLAGPKPARATWTRAAARGRRALYVSSPIGLGHALRDVAIAEELRKLHPDLEIEWLAQPPVTNFLAHRGERVHPASSHLASEVAHIDDEAGEHDLHAFQAIRRMDEILLANFMVLHDLMTEEPFDLVIGDESWDLDYYWHENPELKRSPYVWMTDFVGWIPMAEGGEAEARLTADYNAEMIEHIERHPRVRDRAIFVGSPEDVVPLSFGPGLPSIRDWTAQHYEFGGYVSGFDAADLADVEAWRGRLGYGNEDKICVVTVGGSGVGSHLLKKVIAAYPEAKRMVPGLRMVVVGGPRIDVGRLPRYEGLEVRAYVPDLYRHLAVSDLAVVQGGLTTCMELAASGRPFLYFPLRRHFEQNVHVRYRLERYGAGRCMYYGAETPETIAVAIAEEIGGPVSYRDVETDGAARAASLIAELL